MLLDVPSLIDQTKSFIESGKEFCSNSDNQILIFLVTIFLGIPALWFLILIIWVFRTFNNRVILRKPPKEKYEIEFRKYALLVFFFALISEVVVFSLLYFSRFEDDGDVSLIGFSYELCSSFLTLILLFIIELLCLFIWGIRKRESFFTFLKMLFSPSKLAEAIKLAVDFWKQDGPRSMLKIVIMASLTEYVLGYAFLILVICVNAFVLSKEPDPFSTNEPLGIIFGVASFALRFFLYFLFFKAFCAPKGKPIKVFSLRTLLLLTVLTLTFYSARFFAHEYFMADYLAEHRAAVRKN